jgi:hypothetical protein
MPCNYNNIPRREKKEEKEKGDLTSFLKLAL